MSSTPTTTIIATGREFTGANVRGAITVGACKAAPAVPMTNGMGPSTPPRMHTPESATAPMLATAPSAARRTSAIAELPEAKISGSTEGIVMVVSRIQQRCDPEQIRRFVNAAERLRQSDLSFRDDPRLPPLPKATRSAGCPDICSWPLRPTWA